MIQAKAYFQSWDRVLKTTLFQGICAESIKLCPIATALNLGPIKSTKESLFLKKRRNKGNILQRGWHVATVSFSKRDLMSTPTTSVLLQ